MLFKIGDDLMRKRIKRISIWLILVLIFTMTMSFSVVADEPRGTEKVDVFVEFHVAPGNSGIEMIEAFGGEVIDSYDIVPVIAARLPAAAIAGLSRNPLVTLIEPILTVKATGDEYDWGILRINGDDVYSNGTGFTGEGVKIAIIDTGIDYTHPDLAANYAGGYDFVNDDNDPMDDKGHGTHIAGTIAADDNDEGLIGVAPDAKIYALKVLDASGSGSFADILSALDWCVDNNIDLTNNSYGSSINPGRIVQRAFDSANRAGILNIAAAGNSGNRAGLGDSVEYPGAYASVMAVAATTPDDERAYFSSTGPDVEIAAPGWAIYSTVPNGGYDEYYGTSMATPHVVGAAALVIESGITGANQVRTALVESSQDLGDPGFDYWFGYGLVDASAAVGDLPTTDHVPTVSILSPQDGSQFALEETVTFSATASDHEDGDLADAITWTDQETGTVLGYGGSIMVTFNEAGEYTAVATVEDSFGNESTDTVSFSVGSPVPVAEGSMVVRDISYESGDIGKKADVKLIVDVTITSEADATMLLAGATVTITVLKDEVLYRTATAITDSAGIAHFEFNNVKKGTYYAEPDLVSLDGWTWNADYDYPYDEIVF